MRRLRCQTFVEIDSGGILPEELDVERGPPHLHELDGTIAHDLVSDGGIAGPCVPGLWRRHVTIMHQEYQSCLSEPPPSAYWNCAQDGRVNVSLLECSGDRCKLR